LVPFDQIYQTIMTKLPLTGDLTENETILKFIMNLS